MKRIRMPEEARVGYEIGKASYQLWLKEKEYAELLDKKPRRQYLGFHRHKKRTQGKTMLLKIVKFLKSKRGKYKNDLSFLSKDYFEAVYRYYFKFKVLPFPNQLLPEIKNELRFDEYVEEIDEGCGRYWFIKCKSYWVIKHEVAIENSIGKEKLAFMKHKIAQNIKSEKENRPELFQIIYPESDEEYDTRMNCGDIYYKES